MSFPAPPTPLQIDYIDPDGVDWNLSDLTMDSGFVCTGITGIEGLPISMQTVPLLDGSATPNLYIPQPGTITLGVLVGWPDGGTEDQYYLLLDKVVRAFMNRRNELPAPGKLIIQRPDGSSRQIAVYTTSGLNNPEVGMHNTSYTFSLATPDPYWSDGVQQSLTYQLTNTTGILPVLPVKLAGESVIGVSMINNTGSALAYPTWTITGPGTPTITNVTTGRQWSLNTAIPSGHIVQVTTKPGTQMAVDTTTATNIWDELVLSSLRDLWPFVAGVNQVNIAMAGATVATSVQVNWVNRWSRA